AEATRFGHLDMRTQAEFASALRADTPRSIVHPARAPNAGRTRCPVPGLDRAAGSRGSTGRAWFPNSPPALTPALSSEASHGQPGGSLSSGMSITRSIRIACPSRLGLALGRHHLEDEAVGVAEGEALERGRPLRGDQRGPLGEQPVL